MHYMGVQFRLVFGGTKGAFLAFVLRYYAF